MLEKYVKSNVKIVFQDGKAISVRYGVIISVSRDFVELKTDNGDVLISIPQVVKIERRESRG